MVIVVFDCSEKLSEEDIELIELVRGLPAIVLKIISNIVLLLLL